MNGSGQLENVTVHAYDWVIHDKYADDGHVAIHCWALDKESKPYLLRINNFPAFCFVELPTFAALRGGWKNIVWNKSQADSFISELCKKVPDEDQHPIDVFFCQPRKVYYYQMGRTFPMVRLAFKSIEAMYRFTNMFKSYIMTERYGSIKCSVWETSINVTRKLLTMKKVRYSQWFTSTGYKVDPELRVSTLENEYIIDWRTMTAIPPEETKTWATKPGILAFDIETYTDNHRALPDKYNALHVAYMVSCIYQRLNDPSTRKRYGIIIGDCKDIPKEKLEDCTIIRVKDECELVDELAKVINTTDPEIITGYNIFKYDYPYLNHRIRRWLKKWPAMGRMAGVPSSMYHKEWESGAYGVQSIDILEMEGRISIDLLPYIKRDNKLISYTLDTVSRHFIKKGKHDIKAQEMFTIYEKLQTAMINAKENLSAENVEKLEEAKEEMTRVMAYCIQDSELVIELIERLGVWVGLVEMSNIVGTTLVELFTRGQQVRCISQFYDLAANRGYVIDARDVAGYKFAGGFVFEPIPGKHEKVICLDFSSLYPSIIMAYNICFTTLVHPALYGKVPDSDCNLITCDPPDEDDDEEDKRDILDDTPKEEKPMNTGSNAKQTFKFYKKEEGLLPFLVRNLVSERRAVRKIQAQINFELKALEKTEAVRTTLEKYISGDLEIVSVDEATKRMKKLQDSGADPRIIAEAKKFVNACKIFCTTSTSKVLNDLLNDKVKPHPATLSEAQLEADIAIHYNDKETSKIKSAYEKLDEIRKERLDRIALLKLQWATLESRQLALKVSANSFYGFLGVHTGGKLPLIEGAMSITSKGRELIGLVRKYIEDKYEGLQIYGDTDSIMFTLKQIKSNKDCNYWGRRLSEEISGISPGGEDCDGVIHEKGRPGLFPPPLAMEFEKAMLLLCFKKKKYAALLIGKDGNYKTVDVVDDYGNVIGTKPDILKRGIVLARRDNCKFLRDVYTKLLDMILNGKDFMEAIDYLCDSLNNLLSGKVPIEDLVIVRELGSNYKSNNYFLKVFSDELRKAGKPANPGDRLDFVICDVPTADCLGRKMRLLEQYHENNEKIDYMYYLEKLLNNPLNQLISVGYKDMIEKLPHVFFRPTMRHKKVDLTTPIEIITRIMKYGHTINDFRNAVRTNVEALSK